MRRQQRLRHRKDFAAAYRTGAVFRSQLLVLRVRANPDTALPRFGFAVGKRLGGAVVRNRLKRSLRAAARESGARGGADVVVIARGPAVGAHYHALEGSLRDLLDEARLR
jgi:ribonuclease P protein component